MAASAMRDIGIEYPARGQIAFCPLGPPPPPGRTGILLRTLYSAITNGTERHALLAEHGWNVFPGRHGYQHVCVVEAAGESARGFALGERVFYGAYVGHRGWHLVDVAGPHLCMPLPDDADPVPLALCGVAGVAMRAVRRLRVGPAQNVWVAGLGLIGQFAAQAARAVGALVTVSDLDGARLRLAEELGAHRALAADGPGCDDRLRSAGPFDRILDCAGAPGLLAQIAAGRLLAPLGAIGLIAVRSETCFPWGMLHAGVEGSIEVSCHFDLDDLRVLLHFVRLGIIRMEPLISHRVPIDDALAVYETLRDRPADLLGVVFDWTQ